MKVTVFATYTDGQDGSFSVSLHGTKEEALEDLGKTEEELEEGNIYEDGAMEELNLEFDENGKLINDVRFSAG